MRGGGAFGEVYRLIVAAATVQERDARLETLRSAEGAAAFEVEACVGARELARVLAERGVPDVLVLDTVLDAVPGGSDGIDFVRCHPDLACAAQVIYWDARPENVTRAYTTRHVYHLLEPVTPEDVTDALATAARALRNADARRLFLRVEGRMRAVQPSRITYVESDRRKLHIHAGKDVLTTYATLDALMRDLPDTFVRCHKSFLVNMRYIAFIEATRIGLLSGEVVPVSQKRRRATQEAFARYVGVGA